MMTVKCKVNESVKWRRGTFRNFCHYSGLFSAYVCCFFFMGFV